MAQSIYGGRIDNEFDQRLLITFLDRLFTTGSFDSEFKLAFKVDGHKDIKMPDGIRFVLRTPTLSLIFFRMKSISSYLSAPPHPSHQRSAVVVKPGIQSEKNEVTFHVFCFQISIDRANTLMWLMQTSETRKEP